MRAAATAVLTATVGLVPLLVGLAAPVSAATTDIRINEIITNSATVVDSIELTNIGAEPVDVSGWIVKDNNDTRTLAVAAGTTVAPGAFVTVPVDVAGGFGLGNGDAARIYLPDGTTLVDGHTFASHSAPSWSRCPDGTGSFVQASAETLGAANACASVADLVINEVESNGDPVSDWVEIGNPTTSALDASGLVVKDNDNTHAMAVPAGTTIPAKGYVAVYTEPAGDPAGFGLGSADSARLFGTDGTTLIDTYTWTGGHAATSYGRCPDLSGSFAVTAAPTRAAANQCPLPAGAGDVKINEIITNSSTVGDSIELTNIGASAVDISGFVLKDNDDAAAVAIPAGTTIPAGGFLSFLTNTGATGFGLGNGDAARLFLSDGVTLLDSHTFASHSNPSWSRCPDGTGDFVQAQAESLGAANACTVPDTDVRINEVESNGDATDWVELYNTGTGAVDISGWIVKDNGASPTEQATVPAGTSLAAGGYYAVDTDVDTGSTNFGLGSADQARVFAEDGTTLIDSYEWTAHATTTYGRCPNGTGEFTTTAASTKAAANDCPTPAGADALEINEVSSNPADFVEVRNVSDAMVDASDFWFIDNDPTHTPIRITTESTPLQPGDLFSFAPDQITGGFGLGAADSANVLLSDKTTVVDTYSWTSHRTPSYGRCPDADGLVQNAATSPGAENVCQPVRINEVESNGGTPGDWIELINMTASPVDVSGWVVRDNDDTHTYAIPTGTTLAASGYYVVEEAALGFGLGSGDSARLFRADGTTLVDSYVWTSHATTTYGRCPNGTGGFVTTESASKGAANVCPPPFYGVDTDPWPGSQTITESDPLNAFVSDVSTGDVSGLAFDPTQPGVLWAVKNKNRLFKLTKVDGKWTPMTTDGWAGGKALLFASGTGEPDTEGVTVGPDGAIYATTERDNTASNVALNAVLRFDATQPGPLTATAEWNLDADFPELDGIAGGSNLGFEGLTWVPDSYLVAGGFVDQSTSGAYDPADYPGHGNGLFFMALENDGALYAYALGSGTHTRVAKVASGFPHVMDVSFDPERQQLWAACDDTCEGQVSFLDLGATGAFEVLGGYQRPTGMPNLNNEGFAIAPQSTCASGSKEVVWADDAGTGGHSLRSGDLPCTGLIAGTTAPAITGTARAGATLTASAGSWSVEGVTASYQWLRDGVAIEGATASTYPVVLADKGEPLTVTVTVTKDGYAPASATSAPVTVEDLPLLVTAPAITGSGQVGSALTVSSGTWDESGLTYGYQWLRSGSPIEGATAASYTPTAADLAAGGVSAVVTATRSGGSVSGAPATAPAKTVVAGDAAQATALPTISGTARAGEALTATAGTWSPASGLTFGYQWRRDGNPIGGATATTYVVTGADKGTDLTVVVTASRAGYTDGTATSAAAAVEDLPLLDDAPVITGSGKVGDALTVSSGTWDESGLTYGYQWLRSGSPIEGATAASYTPTAADLAAGSVSAVVTASRTGGASGVPVTAQAVAVVAGDAATASALPTVSGTPVTGQRLTAGTGTWSVPGLGFTFQWLREGAPIAGATGSSYRLVGADAGRDIAVRVTAARAGYEDGTATSREVRATSPVASKTRLTVVKKLAAGKKAALTVKVTGALDPTGTVKVVLDPAKGRTITLTGKLRNGTLKVSSPKLAAGTYQVKATYGGDDLHRGSTSTTTRLVVKAKKGR